MKLDSPRDKASDVVFWQWRSYHHSVCQIVTRKVRNIHTGRMQAAWAGTKSNPTGSNSNSLNQFPKYVDQRTSRRSVLVQAQIQYRTHYPKSFFNPVVIRKEGIPTNKEAFEARKPDAIRMQSSEFKRRYFRIVQNIIFESHLTKVYLLSWFKRSGSVPPANFMLILHHIRSRYEPSKYPRWHYDTCPNSFTPILQPSHPVSFL